MKIRLARIVGVCGVLGTLTLLVYKAAHAEAPLSACLQGTFVLPSLFLLALLSPSGVRLAGAGYALSVACTGIFLLASINEALLLAGIEPVPTRLNRLLNLSTATIAFLAAARVFRALAGASLVRDLLAALLLMAFIGLFQRLESGADTRIHGLDNALLFVPLVVPMSGLIRILPGPLRGFRSRRPGSGSRRGQGRAGARRPPASR